MHGSTGIEKIRTTYYLRVGASGRRERIYRTRPSRQVRLRAALAESGWAR